VERSLHCSPQASDPRPGDFIVAQQLATMVLVQALLVPVAAEDWPFGNGKPSLTKTE